MPEVLEMDLRALGAARWADLWGQSLGGQVGRDIAAAVAAQTADPHAPLLPDLTASVPVIVKAIRHAGADRIRLRLPPALGVETRLCLQALRDTLEPRIPVLGGAASALDLDACPSLTRAGLSADALAAEGRASEVLLSCDASVLQRGAALLQLKQPQAAADLPGLRDSVLGCRIRLLALRGAGRMTDLAPARAALCAPDGGDRLANAWHLFDRAVASSDDPVRLGYLRLLTEARRLAWGQSAQLDAGLALWGATYHFHAGDMRRALAGHIVGLATLRRIGAWRRAIHVGLRTAHLHKACQRHRAALREAARSIAAARGLARHEDADALSLCQALWRGDGPDHGTSPVFRSGKAQAYAALRAVAIGRASLDDWHPQGAPRLAAEALLARILRGDDSDRATDCLADCLSRLSPVDRDMMLHKIASAAAG